MKAKLPFELDKLCKDIQDARLTLQTPRQERAYATQLYVGKHWSENGSRQMQPVNLLGLYTSIMSHSLVAKNPRVMLSTFQRQHKPVVTAMQSWANKEIGKINLANTLERAVVDALFSIGIVKVALATPADAASFSWNLRAGEPFAERVDLDDFVFDIHARDFSECSFMGHRIRVPLESVKKSKVFKASRKDLIADDDPFYNKEGDERISMLGRGYYSSAEEMEPMIDLWEIYCPRHRLVVTLLDRQLSGPEGSDEGPLRVQRWLGRDRGPYHILGFGIVPGNAMPKAPIQDLVDLHEAVNRVYRKVFRTIDRLKEVTGVRGGATEDGSRVMAASDGDLIRLDDPQNVVQLVLSGNTIQTLLLVAPHLKDLFSWMAGNLEMLGGLSPQSKTLGQDKMLEASASRTVSDMQDRTVNYTADILESLCWYWHHDPFKQMRSTHSLPGMPDISIPRTVNPQQRRQVPFEDLEIKVDPYSMQHSTPQMRMQQLQSVFQNVIIPLMPLLQQQGIAVDINAYLGFMAKFLDMPELSDVITIQEPPQQDGESGGGGGAQPGPGPANTNRTYTRENMPGRTQQGDNMNLMNAMRGVNPGGNPNMTRNGNGAMR